MWKNKFKKCCKFSRCLFLAQVENFSAIKKVSHYAIGKFKFLHAATKTTFFFVDFPATQSLLQILILNFFFSRNFRNFLLIKFLVWIKKRREKCHSSQQKTQSAPSAASQSTLLRSALPVDTNFTKDASNAVSFPRDFFNQNKIT